MGTQKLIRWSGLALLVAGMLWLLSILHPPDTLAGMLAPAWGPSHYVTAVASLFLVFGLIGLYAHHAARVGWLGLIAFVLTLAASAMLISAEVFAGALAPTLASSPATQSLVDPQQAGPFVVVIGLIAVLATVGNVLLGIAIIRAGVLPRWAGLLIIIGFVLLASGIGLPALAIISPGGIVLSGLGYAWCGYAIWATIGTEAPQARTTI
ncbi:MAG TPA: hypothetical protein VJL34_14115 [Anaerolineales bacterium]|nr:hypothetical protein [Anaerolineales bacterium]